MSRIGKLPITLPPTVKVAIKESQVTVTGPKGALTQSFDPAMTIAQKENILTVARPTDSKQHRALHGLTRSLLANMVTGVSTGFEKNLEIVGVGYRAEKDGDKLVLRVGASTPFIVPPTPGITLQIEGNNRLKIVGIDKQLVGETAARIRRLRPPDHYKGKGIRYAKEVIKLKPGKAGKVVGKK